MKMNILEFKEKYKNYKDVDKIEITCDHPQHEPKDELIKIGKQPAKRNILKNDGKMFICRDCFMKYNNPMNRVGQSRQTDEIISVYCPHEDHKGDKNRQMKKSCYQGPNKEPYVQTCKSCAQTGKVITKEQKELISKKLKGRKLSKDHVEKILNWRKEHPEWAEKTKNNLIPGLGGGWNEGLKLPEDVKQKMSIAHSGKEFTDEHCENISIGRKKMLVETGGFSKEHREKISKATIKQYQNGFEPKLHHVSGWHNSPKAGKVFFRSSYEKKAFIKLDEDNAVQTYKVEAVSTEYFNTEKEINSSYLIDLFVEYTDGSKKLIEVKPEKWLEDNIVSLKIEAGKNKAHQMGIPFEIWTEMNLFGHVYNKKNMQIFIDKIKSGKV